MVEYPFVFLFCSLSIFCEPFTVERVSDFIYWSCVVFQTCLINNWSYICSSDVVVLILPFQTG